MIKEGDKINVTTGEKDPVMGKSMWYDNFEMGDVIRRDININGVKSGHTKDFILTKDIFDNIKKYEDDSNFYNMRVVGKP